MDVTICIPSFNRADLVSETLDSILAQTHPLWEALIVEDGSTDDSVAVIAGYARRDPRVRLITRAREPKGACTCRNIAVENGRGRYVMFLDTDDLLAPFCIEQRLAVMDENPHLDFAVFPMLLFQDDARTADRLWNVDTEEDDLVRLLRLDPICQGTGTLWRRDSFRRSGMWDEQLRLWQDIELHLRAFAGGYRYAKRLDLRPDVFIRETDASLSRGSYQSREKLESRSAVARRAVATLRQLGRAELVPQVRYFCSSVVLGAIGTNNFDLAREMREWGLREGVLSPREARGLRFAELFRASRLDRIPAVQRMRDQLASAFSAKSTLGRIRVATRDRIAADRRRVEPAGSVSVVVPVRNEAGRIAACIEGILNQTIKVREIIVIDSGSTDGTLEILSRYPEVRVLAIDVAEFNHGETRNLGVRSATSDWVVLTVGDARPADAGWIERLFQGVIDAEVVGVCGAQVVPHERDANPAEWFRPISEPRLERVQFSSEEQFDRLAPAEKLKACSWDDVTALYRRDVVLRIPFRRTTFAEDAIWAKDALRAGHALVYNPAARVYHFHTETPEFTFKRTLSAMYHRYRSFGYLYDEPKLAVPLLRAFSVVIRQHRLSWRERASWSAYAWRNHRAARSAVRAFREAATGGTARLEELHEHYCGTPPIPQKTSGLRPT